MIAPDFAFLKRRATSNPEGPEALRLDWLRARAIVSPLRCLLDLISQYLERRYSIPEIDAYIDEQLANATETLERAHHDGGMTPRKLHALKETIELAEAAYRTCRDDSTTSIVLVHALETAARLQENGTPRQLALRGARSHARSRPGAPPRRSNRHDLTRLALPRAQRSVFDGASRWIAAVFEDVEHPMGGLQAMCPWLQSRRNRAEAFGS